MEIEAFEDSMMDAYNEVFDCWEREFLTRLWRISLDHHTNNWQRTQDASVCTSHDHIHPMGHIHPFGGIDGSPTGDCDPTECQSSPDGDSYNFDTTPMNGHLTCPGHLSLLLKPIPLCYRVRPIAHIAQNFSTDLKALCQWMTAAI